MTRINCVPPSELTNKHLVAEYRELPRIFALARPCQDVPKEYCLGKGHMLFFYDKLSYLAKRQFEIVRVMLERGMNLHMILLIFGDFIVIMVALYLKLFGMIGSQIIKRLQ